jgi:hypothetical protein
VSPSRENHLQALIVHRNGSGDGRYGRTRGTNKMPDGGYSRIQTLEYWLPTSEALPFDHTGSMLITENTES